MKTMRLCLFLALATMACGCASTKTPDPVVVSGNGHCTPAVDLPDHKTMNKVPETETFMEGLYSLFGTERHDHSKDVSDYNSLWNTCVGKSSVK